MNDQKRVAVVSALFEKKNKRKPKNSKELQDFVKSQGGDEFLKKVDEYIAQVEAEQTKQAKKAAHGAKLTLIKNLKHQCADDEELYYYKRGGSVGCGCKKKENGGEVVKAEEGIITKFKKHIRSKFEEAKEKADQIQAQKNYKPDYTSKRIKDSEKDYLEGKGDHKIKQNCGGSKVVAKFKAAKCGTKMKKK